ncbi:hybrid sensor histidine kinase/response regulator [Chroococcidiopsis sp. CCALA 051]|nr:PAS domain-containing sensor histidine kinase [Chroococcidiopsis sp. CCALA 051]PSM49924.1 hybrid sensor histidine kinase/response regulator [Chroococcidiopsis sp. CCALA 051]
MEQLKQAQQKFSILDQVPLGACILRSDLTILFWNSCLEEWTKLSRAEMLGTCIGDRYPHFHQIQYANRLQQIFQGGPPTIFSSQLHKHVIPASLPQGQMRIQHTTVTSLPALEGDEFYALLSIQDVTDLTFRVQEYRQMRDRALVTQETAEKANRVKDEFLAIVSHELRSPLNPILGWSRLLRTNQLNPATIDRALDTIERNAKLQAQLIEDLLDVSRILRGKLKLNWEIVDLANTITSALDTVVLAAEAKSIQIGLSLNPNVGMVRGDSSRLQQVVWNLLSNAVKFTPSGGQIEISLTRVGSKEQEAGSRDEQGAGGREQRSRGESQPITHYPLPITHYQLPTTPKSK